MKKSWLWLAAIGCLSAHPALAVVGGGEITLKGGKAGDVVFSHERHVVEGGLGCRKCHPAPYLDVSRHKSVSMAEMQKGKSCGACHNGKSAFNVAGNCRQCHQQSR